MEVEPRNFEYCLYFAATEHTSVSEDFFARTERDLTNFRVLLDFFACGLAAVVRISECAFPVLELLPQLEGLGWLRLRGGWHHGGGEMRDER